MGIFSPTSDFAWRKVIPKRLTLIVGQRCTVSCLVIYLSGEGTDGSDRQGCLSWSAPCLAESGKVLSDFMWDVFVSWDVYLFNALYSR